MMICFLNFSDITKRQRHLHMKKFCVACVTTHLYTESTIIHSIR